MHADKTEHFFCVSHPSLGQVLQGIENRGALLQAAQGQFAQNKRMRQHLPALEQTG